MSTAFDFRIIEAENGYVLRAERVEVESFKSTEKLWICKNLTELTSELMAEIARRVMDTSPSAEKLYAAKTSKAPNMLSTKPSGTISVTTGDGKLITF